MRITRRDFLKYCTISAGALGLSTMSLLKLEKALAKEGEPTVVWLQGQACGGCVTSMLNSITYTDIASLLTAEPVSGALLGNGGIDLNYMPVVMAAAGDLAISAAANTATAAPAVLVVEGSIPVTPNLEPNKKTVAYSDNHYCDVWELSTSTAVGMVNAVRNYFSFTTNPSCAITGPSYVIALGTCAAYGGIPAANPNPTGARGVEDIITDKYWIAAQISEAVTSSNVRTLQRLMIQKIINVAGCPPHPDWFVGTVAYILTHNAKPPLDSLRRPLGPGEQGYFNQRLCDECPRFNNPIGCLKMIGCKGMRTKADCSYRMWNVEPGYSATGNYCPNSGSPCLGCVTPKFWDRNAPFFKLR